MATEGKKRNTKEGIVQEKGITKEEGKKVIEETKTELEKAGGVIGSPNDKKEENKLADSLFLHSKWLEQMAIWMRRTGTTDYKQLLSEMQKSIKELGILKELAAQYLEPMLAKEMLVDIQASLSNNILKFENIRKIAKTISKNNLMIPQDIEDKVEEIIDESNGV